MNRAKKTVKFSATEEKEKESRRLTHAYLLICSCQHDLQFKYEEQFQGMSSML